MNVAATRTGPSVRLGRWTWLLEWFVVLTAVFVLIQPLFRSRYLDLWYSIESTFIADARFLKDHWPDPKWQPNWYCGTRTTYVYPPALRYGTAALAKYVPDLLPVKAYHIYSGFFYCFGIAAVFLFARWCSRSRGAAFLAAAATALVSPSYLFIRTIRDDAVLGMPYRLHVLIRYGEGPHMTALAWIPLALLFSLRAMERWRPVSLAAAAFCSAMVVSNNFYGATALAMLFPILAWSVYITHSEAWMWIRAAAIAVLAYGLTAFWLTPSYLQITLRNMQFVSFQGNTWSRWTALATVMAFVLLSYRFARGQKDRQYLTFLIGSSVVFLMNSAGNHFLNFRILGEPSRLFPELDMLLTLLAVELLRRIWIADWRWPILIRALCVLTVVAGLAPSWFYLKNSRAIFVATPDYTQRIEFQMQDWVARNRPQLRSLAAGSVRFWFNVWHDLPMLGGGSEQGLLNPKVVAPQYQIFLSREAEASIRWMQILGVDTVLVNGKQSRENYHDFQYPEKFRGKLAVLYDNQIGDVIYDVPRRYRSRARVVDRAAHSALPVITGNGEVRELNAWYDVVERGPEARTETRWEGTDTLHVSATVREGQSVWVQESFDSNWTARIEGRSVPVREDNLGFMIIDVPPGNHEIRLDFPLPWANLLGRIVTLLSFTVLAGLIWLGLRT